MYVREYLSQHRFSKTKEKIKFPIAGQWLTSYRGKRAIKKKEVDTERFPTYTVQEKRKDRTSRRAHALIITAVIQ